MVPKYQYFLLGIHLLFFTIFQVGHGCSISCDSNQKQVLNGILQSFLDGHCFEEVTQLSADMKFINNVTEDQDCILSKDGLSENFNFNELCTNFVNITCVKVNIDCNSKNRKISFQIPLIYSNAKYCISENKDINSICIWLKDSELTSIHNNSFFLRDVLKETHDEYCTAKNKDFTSFTRFEAIMYNNSELPLSQIITILDKNSNITEEAVELILSYGIEQFFSQKFTKSLKTFQKLDKLLVKSNITIRAWTLYSISMLCKKYEYNEIIKHTVSESKVEKEKLVIEMKKILYDTMKRNSTLIFKMYTNLNEINNILLVDKVLNYENFTSNLIQNRLLDKLVCVLQSSYWQKFNLYGNNVESIVLLSNISNIFHLLGRSNDALKIEQKIFQFNQERLGDLNDATVASLHNLAKYLTAVNKSEEALLLQNSLLAKQKTKPNDDNPDSLFTMLHIAEILRTTSKLNESLKLEEFVLKKRNESLGVNNIKTLNSMKNVGLDLNRLSRYDEQLSILKSELRIRQSLQGELHTDTIDNTKRLIKCLTNLQQYDEAYNISQILFEKCTLKFGAENDETLNVMEIIPSLLENLNKTDDALEVAFQLFKIGIKTLSYGDPRTINALQILVKHSSEKQNFETAYYFALQLLDRRVKSLGLKHPDTEKTSSNILYILAQMGQISQLSNFLTYTITVSQDEFNVDEIFLPFYLRRKLFNDFVKVD